MALSQYQPYTKDTQNTLYQDRIHPSTSVSVVTTRGVRYQGKFIIFLGFHQI